MNIMPPIPDSLPNYESLNCKYKLLCHITYLVNGDDTCYSWKIDSICYDWKRLSLTFNFCSFCWVRRETNNVVHCLAKFASMQNLSLCYNNSSHPPSG